MRRTRGTAATSIAAMLLPSARAHCFRAHLPGAAAQAGRLSASERPRRVAARVARFLPELA
jgi:hypothetical protein